MRKMLMFVFLIPFILQAESATSIKIGSNFSTLRAAKGKRQPGICFGLGKEYFDSKLVSGFVGVDLLFSQKRTKLENKTWPSNLDPASSNVVRGDLGINISFIDLPLRMGYIIHPGKQDFFFFKIYSGVMLSVPVSENNKVSNSTDMYLEPDEKDTYKFDYYRWEEVTINPAINFQVGFDLFYQNFGLEFHWYRAATETKCSNGLTIKDEIDTFQLMVACRF